MVHFSSLDSPIGDSPSYSGFHFLTLRTRIFRNHPLPCYFLSLTSHVTGAHEKISGKWMMQREVKIMPISNTYYINMSMNGVSGGTAHQVEKK